MLPRGDDGPAIMEGDDFFASETPPAGLDEVAAKAAAFVRASRAAGRRVALVSSGGTTVPLERQTVRFLDNFSAGTRGSAAAEYFLEHGYAVIFLHRSHSLCPFHRRLKPALELLQVRNGAVAVKDDYQTPLLQTLQKYQKAVQSNALLNVPFVTLSEYLFLLRTLSAALAPLGSEGLFFLAAAVSDYFIPEDKMATHKIQSSDGPLAIHLQQSPKIIRPIVAAWAHGAFIISFKLETDPNLLVPKSRSSLDRYGHNLVIANLLQTRKHSVLFVHKDQSVRPEPIDLLQQDIANGTEIESIIVPKLISIHTNWINSQTKS